MSNPDLVRVLDPRLQFPESHKLLALSGSDYINAVQYPVNSLSDSNIVIQCNPASERVAVGSNFLLHTSFSITVNGTNTNTGAGTSLQLMVPNLTGPSFMPIRQVVTSETLSINGTVCPVQNPHLFMPALMSTYEGKTLEYSMTPSMPDFGTSFLDNVASGMTSSRNPLASTYDQIPNYVSRGAFVGWNEISNAAGATQATFTLDCAEPLIVSPLKFGKGSFEEVSLTNINNMLYNATLANLNRVVSIAYPLVGGVPTLAVDYVIDGTTYTNTVAITSMIVHITKAELLILNMSMSPQVPRPERLINSYSEVIDYNTSNFTPLAPGNSTTISLGNQTLGSIPRSIYLFVPCMPDVYTQSSTPSCCTIPVAFLQWGGGPYGFSSNSDFQALSVNFDNVTQLQSFTMWDLYKIGVKNGCCMEFSELVGMAGQNSTDGSVPNSNGRGTVIKLNVGEDIVLNPGFCVGTTGKFNVSIQATVWNQTVRTLPSTVLHMVAVYDGLQTITSSGQTVNHQASFTHEEVENTPIDVGIKFKPVRQLFGGSFFDTLKGILSPLKDIVKSTGLVGDLASKIPGVGKFAGPIAKSLGYGASRQKLAGVYAGGVYAGAGGRRY